MVSYQSGRWTFEMTAALRLEVFLKFTGSPADTQIRLLVVHKAERGRIAKVDAIWRRENWIRQSISLALRSQSRPVARPN